MSQLDLFGSAIPVEELDWPLTLQALAAHERELGARLSADEAGAWLHARRGKHDGETRCRYCTEDGRDVLNRLRNRRPLEGAAEQTRSPRLADNSAVPSSGSPRRLEGSQPSARGDHGSEEHRGRYDDATASPSRSAARARSADPATSHAAAASVTGLTETKGVIVELFRRFGSMTDEELVDRYIEERQEPGSFDYGGPAPGTPGGWSPSLPPATPSSIRTRRSELVRAGLVVDSGRTKRLEQTGRYATIWALSTDTKREYDPEPPL